MISLISSLSPHPGGLGDGTENFNHLISPWSGFSGNQPPSWSYLGAHLEAFLSLASNKTLITLEIPRIFRSSCVRNQGQKPNNATKDAPVILATQEIMRALEDEISARNQGPIYIFLITSQYHAWWSFHISIQNKCSFFIRCVFAFYWNIFHV